MDWDRQPLQTLWEICISVRLVDKIWTGFISALLVVPVAYLPVGQHISVVVAVAYLPGAAHFIRTGCLPSGGKTIHSHTLPTFQGLHISLIPVAYLLGSRLSPSSIFLVLNSIPLPAAVQEIYGPKHWSAWPKGGVHFLPSPKYSADQHVICKVCWDTYDESSGVVRQPCDK